MGPQLSARQDRTARLPTAPPLRSSATSSRLTGGDGGAHQCARESTGWTWRDGERPEWCALRRRIGWTGPRCCLHREVC
jgi:hypothetical protein